MSKSFIEQSTIPWYNEARQANPTNEDIQTGALQRIAAATETMAQNYSQLIAERNRYQQWYNERRERVWELERKLSATRGVVTKLKNQIAKLTHDQQRN